MVCTNWNLKNIYPSNEEFKRDLTVCRKKLKNLEKFKGKLDKNNKKIILDYFKQDSEFSVILEKLAVYARVKLDDNGKDEQNLKNYAEIESFFSEVSTKLAFVKTEMSNLSDKFLKDLENDAEFCEFNREIVSVLRQKKFTLSENEEAMFASISEFSNTDDIYSTLTDIEMDHGEFVDEEGKRQKLTTGNFNMFMKSNNASIRKSVYEAYLGEYKKLNLTLAGLYISHIKHLNYVATKHGFESAKSMLAYDEEVDENIMTQNIEQVSKRAKLLQEYFKLKKKMLGLSKFYVSDIFANLTVKNDDNIPYDEAVSQIKEALAVLGEDYIAMFQMALDEGWIDAYPRENKSSGGYTIHTYSVHPYILLNYDGTAYWKSAIAHEFGHAMHSYYSAKAQPYSKSSYTIFVAEVASLTNEILLSAYEIKKETNVERKKQYLSDFLQLFYLNVYNSSMLAEFEIFAHESLQKGAILSANELNQYFLNLSKKYFGDSVQFNENYEYDWSRKSHIFRDYYLYKYSTGLISACAVAKNILEDTTGEYVKKYKKFLSLGGSKPPVESLLEADIDILSEKTYNQAFALFEKYLKELNEISK